MGLLSANSLHFDLPRPYKTVRIRIGGVWWNCLHPGNVYVS